MFAPHVSDGELQFGVFVPEICAHDRLHIRAEDGRSEYHTVRKNKSKTLEVHVWWHTPEMRAKKAQGKARRRAKDKKNGTLDEYCPSSGLYSSTSSLPLLSSPDFFSLASLHFCICYSNQPRLFSPFACVRSASESAAEAEAAKAADLVLRPFSLVRVVVTMADTRPLSVTFSLVPGAPQPTRDELARFEGIEFPPVDK